VPPQPRKPFVGPEAGTHTSASTGSGRTDLAGSARWGCCLRLNRSARSAVQTSTAILESLEGFLDSHAEDGLHWCLVWEGHRRPVLEAARVEILGEDPRMSKPPDDATLSSGSSPASKQHGEPVCSPRHGEQSCLLHQAEPPCSLRQRTGSCWLLSQAIVRYPGDTTWRRLVLSPLILPGDREGQARNALRGGDACITGLSGVQARPNGRPD
jgi:hypothetical protein